MRRVIGVDRRNGVVRYGVPIPDPKARPVGEECQLILGAQEIAGNSVPLADGELDALHCHQILEHFHEPEVAQILLEVHRVLRPGGILVLSVPDLAAAARDIASGRPVHTIDGGLRPLDLIYGHPGRAQHDPLYAHHTGFTATMLQSWLGAARFEGRVDQLAEYRLWVEAYKIG